MNKNPKPFSPDQFTPTKFSSAKDKADFGNSLVSFILDGFSFKKFTKKLYDRLNSTFGHCAEYNQKGFYDTWFSDPNQIRSWFRHIAEYSPVGSSDYTFADLEKEFKAWLNRNNDLILDIIQKLEVDAEMLAESAGSSVEFKVVAISSNTGSFGHKQHVLIGENGVGVKGMRQPHSHNPSLEDLKEGDILSFEVDANGSPVNWNAHGFEHIETIPNRVPENLMKETWGESVKA